MVDKPPHGQPCNNNCGLCCRAALCPLASMVFVRPFHDEGPCPALEGDKCGLMMNPRAYAPVRAALLGDKPLSDAAAHLIGAGKGCDAQADDEPADEAYSRRIRQESNPRKTNAALRVWGFSS